jgi:hypothetical protein
MLSLYRLLFKKSYWRQLTLGSTWHEAGLSLRRAHKDRRARKYLLGLGLMLIIPAVCLAYLIWLLQSGAVFLIPFVIPVIWWIRRSNRLNEPVHITPQPEPPRPVEMSPEQRNQFCAALGELGLFYAVMLDRAGSELFVQRKELPPNVEIVSRRTHIDLLRRTGLWDKLSPADREAIMIADGHWDPETVQRVSLAMEPFRLIRWLLRVDFYLPVVGKQAKADFGLSHEIVLAPEKLLASRELIGPEGLDIALRSARDYFYRCFAESIHRGYATSSNGDSARWASEIVTRLSGRQHDDLTIGTKLVSEADEDEILWTMTQSHARMTFLTWITSLVNEARQPTLPYTLLQPATDPEPATQAAVSS